MSCRKILSGFLHMMGIVLAIFIISFASPSHAAEQIKIQLDPIACPRGSCPTGLEQLYTSRGESCVGTYEDFKEDPSASHFWAEDPQVTTQGKADERARQFIAWVLGKNAIDNHPTITAIWSVSRNIAYFFVMLLAAILGVGFIIGQRTNFTLKIKILPSVIKIASALLYITFSATIVLLLVQLSEVFMKFFIENLGADKLFNIYFADTKSVEKNYLEWVGCRDLNIRVQEAADTQLFMLKLTNITYYALGIMLLLRKIILWFLLFVSPFLALLFPFIFIRNVGWIWIGVFFQWLFYGPLLALFLGGMAKLWKDGIPFIFDFQRANTPEGYVYPTATSILYGGPAQQLSVMNNGNYIDTFVEYIITLIMLWAVIILPWWLLRIFRDYCCDGINAMKNILLSMYDQMRGGPSPTSPGPSPVSVKTGTTIKVDQAVSIKARLETVEEIKRTKTEEISKTLNLSATKLTDIARLETNKEVRETVRKNIEYLSNPTKADTPTERQKYMNIRSELFNRAIKEDTIAKQLLSATSAGVERIKNQQKILQEAPALTPVTQVVSYKVKLPVEKVSSITSSVTASIAANTNLVNTIAQKTQVTSNQVQIILTSYQKNANQPSFHIVPAIAKENNIQKETVAKVIKQVASTLQINTEIAKDIAQKEQVKQEEVQQVIQMQMPMVAEAEAHIEQAIAIPSSIAIEDYEEVKKMWIQQYEKGEVPVTENVSTRSQWIDQDIVFITNTLNKLLSTDQSLKQQGLDEVGFILPVFMINNLKGDELIVYLKAKLEAAKFVQMMTEREKEITEKLKAKADEIFIDVPAAKKEEASKTMTMAEELKIEDKGN